MRGQLCNVGGACASLWLCCFRCEREREVDQGERDRRREVGRPGIDYIQRPSWCCILTPPARLRPARIVAGDMRFREGTGGGWSGAVPNGACRGRRLGSWGCFGRASPSACVMLIRQSLGAGCHECCSVDGEDPSWWTRRFDVAASVANLLSPVPKLDPIGAMAAPPKPYRPTVTAVSPPGRATYLFFSSATGHGIQRLSTSLDINACTRPAKGGRCREAGPAVPAHRSPCPTASDVQTLGSPTPRLNRNGICQLASRDSSMASAGVSG